jgi:MFS family permease
MAAAPFYGWWVLSAMASLRVVASGVGNNIQSLLVLPMQQEFGVSRADASLMTTAGSAAVALTAPLGGWLMDRYGMRRVMLVCLLITVACYFLLSFAQALWQIIFIFAPLGVTYNWAIFNSGAPILNNWFNRRKTTALSLLSVGHGTGALLLPLMALAVMSLGWRPALVIAGLALLTAGLVAVAIARNTPEEMGLSPDGDPPKDVGASRPAAALSGVTVGQAIRTSFFWAMGLGSACMLFINLSIVLHNDANQCYLG